MINSDDKYFNIYRKRILYYLVFLKNSYDYFFKRALSIEVRLVYMSLWIIKENANFCEIIIKFI